MSANNIDDFRRHLEEHEQVVVRGTTIEGADVRAAGRLTDFDDWTEVVHGHTGEVIATKPGFLLVLNNGSAFVFREYELFVPGTEPEDEDEPAFEVGEDDVPPLPPILRQH